VWTSISTIMSTTSSCQPTIIVRKCNSSGTREFTGKEALRCETLCFCRVKWLLWWPKGGLCLRVQASIWESCRQKVHRTVARARLALQNVKKSKRSEHFWKMRSAKCARDCGESSVSISKLKKSNVHMALINPPAIKYANSRFTIIKPPRNKVRQLFPRFFHFFPLVFVFN